MPLEVNTKSSEMSEIQFAAQYSDTRVPVVEKIYASSVQGCTTDIHLRYMIAIRVIKIIVSMH